MPRNTRLFNDILATPYVYEGDVAECAKWRGWAEAKLKHMLKSKGALSCTFVPAPDVEIRIDTRPNRVSIKVGSETYISIRETANYVTSKVNPVSKMRRLGVLQRDGGALEFQFGLPISFSYINFTPPYSPTIWFTSEKKYAYYKSVQEIKYRDKVYVIPASGAPYSTQIVVADFNATKTTVVATGWYRQEIYGGPNSGTNYVWVVMTAATEEDSLAVIYSEMSQDGPLIPAISGDCTQIIGGFCKSDEYLQTENPNVEYKIVMLAEGFYAGVTTGILATGAAKATSDVKNVTLNPTDLNSWIPASNRQPSTRSLNTRLPSRPYTAGQIVFGSLLNSSDEVIDTAYITCITGGVSSTSTATLQGESGESLTDGSVEWLVGGSITEWEGYVAPEYADVNVPTPEYVGDEQKTLDDLVSEKLEEWGEDGWTVTPVVSPTAFSSTYPVLYYPRDTIDFSNDLGIPNEYDALTGYYYFPHSSVTRIAVYSRTKGASTHIEFLASCRYLPYYTPTRWASQATVTHKFQRAAGQYPIGWVRNTEGGIKSIYRQNIPVSQSGDTSGTCGGARLASYGFCYGVTGPAAEIAQLEANKPTPVGYSYTTASTFSGAGGNGYAYQICIDGLPVISKISGPTTYVETTTSSLTPADHTSATTSSTTTKSITNQTDQTVAKANYQLGAYYVVKHVRPGTLKPSDLGKSDTVERRRYFIFNNVSVFEDYYVVGSGIKYQAPHLLEEYAEIAPVGKPQNQHFIMSVFSYQGAVDSLSDAQWGDNSETVDYGQFQVLIDSDGKVYTEMPVKENINPGKVIPIDAPTWNVDGPGSMISLNIK